MRRQDAATQEPTNQVFGGDAHGLSLPQARSTQPRRAVLALSLHDNFCSFLVFKVFSCQFKFRAVQPEFHQHLQQLEEQGVLLNTEAWSRSSEL